MTSAEWSLLFAGISTICAIIGVPAAIKSYKNKNESEKIKKEIESYQSKILEKQYLLILVPKVEEIKDIIQIFRNVTAKATAKSIKKIDEIESYTDIRDKVSKVLDEVPESFLEIRNLLYKIKEAFGHCLINQKTFSELDRVSNYGYFTVENDLDSVLAKIQTLTREIKF